MRVDAGQSLALRIPADHHLALRAPARMISAAMATLQLDADGTALISQDSWLEPHRHNLQSRQSRFRTALSRFDPTGGLLGQISQGHRYFGFNRGELHGK